MSNTIEVYKGDDGAWVAVEYHEGWEDFTPFATWPCALDHALWLAWRSNRPDTTPCGRPAPHLSADRRRPLCEAHVEQGVNA